jgi:hypothetical protein
MTFSSVQPASFLIPASVQAGKGAGLMNGIIELCHRGA